MRHLGAVVAAFALVALAERPYDPALGRRLEALALSGRALDYTRELTETAGGRVTGSPPYDRAVAWAIAAFEAAGVPRVHTERFTMPRLWERDEHATARIVSPVDRPLRAMPLGWTPPTDPAGIEGDVVLEDRARGSDAASLRGRIVLMSGESSRERARRLQVAGAAALLFADSDSDDQLVARVLQFGGEMTPLPALTVAKDDAAMLRRLIEREPVRIAVTARNRVSAGPAPVRSVFAEIRGRERPDEWVVVGAHLDSWDLGTGAQDNAAGVAMVLEAARAIIALGRAPRRSIRFALWGGEEQGLLGSAAYARDHASELDSFVAVMNVDGGTGRIIGWTTPGREEVEAEVRDLSHALLGRLESDRVDHGMQVAFSSDGAPFLREGVPVLDLNVDDSRYEEIHHRSADTIDRIDTRNLAVGAATVAVTAYAVADAPRRLAPRGRKLQD